MDMFDKVDKIRERADVSYEEAKEALDRSNGDILEAMILLEREGRTYNTGCKTGNAGYDAGNAYGYAEDENNSKKGNNGSFGNNRTFGEKIKSLFHKSLVNYVAIDRKGERILKIPVLAAILVVLFAWHAAFVAVIISLFLDCKYSFEGQDELKGVNEFCTRAGDLADQVKDKVITGYNSL